MDRRLTEGTEHIRFKVDPTRCDGQGVCVMIAPEIFALDRYGDAYVIAGSEDLVAADEDVRARGLEADAMCPRNAIREERAIAVRRERIVAMPAEIEPTELQPAQIQPPSRLLLNPDEPIETVQSWRQRGGWQDSDGGSPSPDGGADSLDIIERAGIFGQGGAGFPTATKWRRVVEAAEPVVVINGAEREPGTIKDHYLLGHRPALVLDGLRLAMKLVGSTEGHIAIDEDAVGEHDAVTATLAEAEAGGLLTGLKIELHKVPTRYVAGEETALINLLNGGAAIPRMRPPFPSESGVAGRPTLVQNVETIAQVALAVALGPEKYRSIGTAEVPGSGLFSVGLFGGQMSMQERPYGYSLRTLISEVGLLDDARAVLVGGYAGGLLPVSALEIALTPDSLASVGASLGTKSIQILGAQTCPVDVAGRIVRYFAGETAEQCPPCFRGLPDMAGLLESLEAGNGGRQAVQELDEFMSTLADRGVCRLPDGAARLTMSLLSSFPDEVEAHAIAGCPLR